MSSIQAYKAHKQEGTLVSNVHKQGALGTSSQASLHQWLHCISNNQSVFSICCNLEHITNQVHNTEQISIYCSRPSFCIISQALHLIKLP